MCVTARPLPTLANLPASTAAALDLLSPGARAVALAEIARMGNFEPDRMFVSRTGKFHVADRKYEGPSRKREKRSVDENEEVDRHRRMLSVVPTGYTAEGNGWGGVLYLHGFVH